MTPVKFSSCQVYRVLKLSTRHIPGYLMYNFLILAGFAFLGMLWFGKSSPYYKSFLSAMENLFTGFIGHSGFKVSLGGGGDLLVTLAIR